MTGTMVSEATVEVLEMVLVEVVITAEASAVAVVAAALAADDDMLRCG